MSIIRYTSTVLCASALLLAAPFASAQTTDGSHAIQVFPVVVDSASFVERLLFRNPHEVDIDIKIRYVPGTGTSQTGALDCPGINIDARRTVQYLGLRQLCPGLAAGTQFGYLYAWTESYNPDRTGLPFSGYSRVDNAQGIGFSVEAFPASTFTSAHSVVTGLRRMAATAGAPAYQTNCFVGNLHDMTPKPNPVTTTVSFQLFKADNTAIGAGQVALVPGRLVRLLDVFDAAGVPPGNHDNAWIRFEESGDGEPSLLTFCAVQDNSSFGADFRIGKQELGLSTGSLIASPFSQDDGLLRESLVGTDVRLATGPGTAAARNFAVPPGSTGNTHVIYFRHPDWVACELIDPALNARAPWWSYGLEMRLLASDGVTVLAGGNDVTGFAPIYLGDKGDRDNGANSRYTIEVESSETNTSSDRPYQLHCRSGSGHGLGELVRTGGPNLF